MLAFSASPLTRWQVPECDRAIPTAANQGFAVWGDRDRVNGSVATEQRLLAFPSLEIPQPDRTVLAATRHDAKPMEDGKDFDENLLHLSFAEIAIASELRFETLPVDEFLDEIGFAVEIDAIEQLRQLGMATQLVQAVDRLAKCCR